MIDDDYLVSGSFRCTIAYYHIQGRFSWLRSVTVSMTGPSSCAFDSHPISRHRWFKRRVTVSILDMGSPLHRNSYLSSLASLKYNNGQIFEGRCLKDT